MRVVAGPWPQGRLHLCATRGAASPPPSHEEDVRPPVSACVLGCSTSGKTDPSGQPSGFAGLLARALPSSAAAQPAPTEQPAPVQQPAQPGLMPAPPSPMQPAQPPPMQPAEPDEPVGFEQPAASGNAEVCSAMCDRVAACQIASKEQCMPVREPQVPQADARAAGPGDRDDVEHGLRGHGPVRRAGGERSPDRACHRRGGRRRSGLVGGTDGREDGHPGPRGHDCASMPDSSHLPEQVQVAAADRQHLVRPFRWIVAVSLTPRVTWLIARRFTTTERCTCDELRGVELRHQFLQRRADQRLAGLAAVAAPGDQRVLLVRAQEVDLVDRDQAQRLADRRADPAQRRRPGVLAEVRGELLQQRFGVQRRLRARSRSCSRATVSARRAGSTGFTR